MLEFNTNCCFNVLIIQCIFVGEIGRWFDIIFGKLEPLEIHIHPVTEMEKLRNEMKERNVTVVNVPGCIMDNPLDKMSIQLIDLDVTSRVNIAIEASKEDSGHRAKKILGTVRGMGGGKTRAFEEMRRMLLLREGALVRSAFILSIES